ncbi:hypothetical protein ACJX0J_011409 [Zea mays]
MNTGLSDFNGATETGQIITAGVFLHSTKNWCLKIHVFVPKNKKGVLDMLTQMDIVKLSVFVEKKPIFALAAGSGREAIIPSHVDVIKCSMHAKFKGQQCYYRRACEGQQCIFGVGEITPPYEFFGLQIQSERAMLLKPTHIECFILCNRYNVKPSHSLDARKDIPHPYLVVAYITSLFAGRTKLTATYSSGIIIKYWVGNLFIIMMNECGIQILNRATFYGGPYLLQKQHTRKKQDFELCLSKNYFLN